MQCQPAHSEVVWAGHPVGQPAAADRVEAVGAQRRVAIGVEPVRPEDRATALRREQRSSRADDRLATGPSAVRKLVSLLLSIWLFGNKLSPGTMLGAVIVFFAGGMYGLEGSKSSGRPKHRGSVSNGKIG